LLKVVTEEQIAGCPDKLYISLLKKKEDGFIRATREMEHLQIYTCYVQYCNLHAYV
jgi:hypothetical protein